MTLAWIESPNYTKNEDGLPFDIHFLYDLGSSRVFGYVEIPARGHFIFVAVPYEGKNRWYLELAAAKSYLEELVFKEDIEEVEVLKSSVREAEKSEVPIP